jgi:hypothetical protein
MRRLKPGAVLISLVVVIAACDQPPEPSDAPAPSATPAVAASATAFTHSFSDDLSGYYMPVDEVRVGDWRLHHLFMGQRSDFAAWEGGTRPATFGPVMAEFEDLSSPMVQTELGESRSGRSRVLPVSYSISDDRVRFTGRSTVLGEVTFDGRLDPGALATARRNLGDETAVLTGTLRVGDRTLNGVRMRWWAGD